MSSMRVGRRNSDVKIEIRDFDRPLSDLEKELPGFRFDEVNEKARVIKATEN